MTLQSPADIRDFWFSEPMQPWWFKQSDEIDQQITTRFGATYQAAHEGKLEGWAESAPDALSLVIVLDQFPRNMFRGDARSYESNDLALRHARQALERGYDMALEPTQRQFFYLPFMHSEDLADQERSVQLYEALDNPLALDFAIQHRDIIARFGRFPHRNAVLGRDTSPEEAEFLKTHDGF